MRGTGQVRASGKRGNLDRKPIWRAFIPSLRRERREYGFPPSDRGPLWPGGRGWEREHAPWHAAHVTLPLTCSTNGGAHPVLGSLGGGVDCAQHSRARPTAWPSRAVVVPQEASGGPRPLTKAPRYLALQLWTAAACEARRRFGWKWRRGVNQAHSTGRKSGVALRLPPQSKATLSLALSGGQSAPPICWTRAFGLVM